MSLTMVEAAKMSTDPVQSAVIEIYARSSDVLQVIPFSNIAGSAYKYNREETLPGIGFRGINEAYDESTGVINPLMEPLLIAGGDMDVDTALVKMHGPNVRAAHEAMKIKAAALRWTEAFIKGDNQSEPREFDGLQVRLTGNQLIAAGSTENGTALSLAKLDELIDAVDGATHLLMNKTMRRRLTQAARNTAVGGYITYGVDAFGRPVMKYNDLPILIVDKDNENNDILPFTEACTSGTAKGTSIYCVAFGEGMLDGIQNGVLEARDLGEVDDGPWYRTRVEWINGLRLQHPRAGARLWSIADGAVTA